MKTILFALLMTISLMASAYNCPAINDEITVCDVATQNANSMSKNLPMELYDDITITSAEAFGSRIVLTVYLELTEMEMIIQLIESGSSVAIMRDEMKASTKDLICQSEELRIFVNAGGGIAYTYNLKDGSRFHFFVIDEC